MIKDYRNTVLNLIKTHKIFRQNNINIEKNVSDINLISFQLPNINIGI